MTGESIESAEGAANEAEFDVGVVVVTFNSARVIGGLLQTLADGLEGLDARAVVVDNDSFDQTVSLARRAGLDVVASGSNDGYAVAINRGTRRFPNARSILVLNPDVQLTRGAVAAMYRELSDRRVGVVAPKVYHAMDPPSLTLSQRRDPSLLRAWAGALLGAKLAGRWPATFEGVSDRQQYEVRRDVDWAYGAVLLASRRCVDAVGDWDESYFLYSEETDYCQRARDAGFVVRYTPASVVVHTGGDSQSDPHLRAMWAVNRVRLYRRRHGRVAAWCFFVGAMLHELTRGIAGNPAARHALRALASPQRRPREVNARTFMPR